MAGEGRCSCRCITSTTHPMCGAGAAGPGRGQPRTSVARRSPRAASPLRRPIAKFNAKVMRARVRLRAAMQERPAAATGFAISAPPAFALHAASQIFRALTLMGHLTDNPQQYLVTHC